MALRQTTGTNRFIYTNCCNVPIGVFEAPRVVVHIICKSVFSAGIELNLCADDLPTQEPGHPFAVYVALAQSPHNARLMMML
jgi:hypothetical protein